MHADAITPAETGRCFVALFPAGQRPSPDYRRVGFRVKRFEACSAFTRVPACMVAEPPTAALLPECFSPCRYLHEPPWPLPAGAIAAWDSHPPGGRAFPRRTVNYTIHHGKSTLHRVAGLPGVVDEFGSRRISSRTSLRETNLVTAMLRAYPECGTVPPPCSPCGAAGNVNLHEDLGLNRRQSSIPTYSPSAPRSKWKAVQQGQARGRRRATAARPGNRSTPRCDRSARRTGHRHGAGGYGRRHLRDRAAFPRATIGLNRDASDTQPPGREESPTRNPTPRSPTLERPTELR